MGGETVSEAGKLGESRETYETYETYETCEACETREGSVLAKKCAFGGSREAAAKKAAELKSAIGQYLAAKPGIKAGHDMEDRAETVKRRILKALNAGARDWDDWKWQLKNRIRNTELLEKIIPLTADEKASILEAEKRYRWAVSPYYLSLADPDGGDCPIRRQAFPSRDELIRYGESDPMSEKLTSPVEGITRRYPDRLIVNVTNVCAMFCRHCQRRRNIGARDASLQRDGLEACFGYIAQNPEIRDVVITGGDPMCLADEQLVWILSRLRAIKTVEIIRIGTRTVVTMPQRVTGELCEKLRAFHPLYVNTQVNHPAEMTRDAVAAAGRLADAGVVLGNQAVLLNGVNNDPNVMTKLSQELLKARIRPYYVFHPKQVVGTKHFYVPIDEGLGIMDELRGKTSGLANPTYIINAPGGQGKIPLQKPSILKNEGGHIEFRTWEGKTVPYEEYA
jgi:lysine 2,3-aminomutase